MTKTIGDNYRIHSLIIILNARIVASVRCGLFKMSNMNHLTMLLFLKSNTCGTLVQISSMNKHQGVTQCMPHASDANSWDHKLNALEGMMAQVVAVTKNDALQGVEVTINQNKVFMVQNILTKALMNFKSFLKIFYYKQ